MAEIREVEVKCRVRPGMFKDEWIVRIVTVATDGSIREVESIAYDDTVTREADGRGSDEVPGRVRAYVVGRTGNTAAVVLPQTTMSNGPSVLVPEAELVER